jgi:hypothetical protein
MIFTMTEIAGRTTTHSRAWYSYWVPDWWVTGEIDHYYGPTVIHVTRYVRVNGNPVLQGSLSLRIDFTDHGAEDCGSIFEKLSAAAGAVNGAVGFFLGELKRACN